MAQYIIFGISYALVAAVQPGPLFTYLLIQTISKGWKRTFPAVFAPVLSDLPVIVITLFILTKLPSILISFLQIGGGLFLLYLAAGAAISWRSYQPVENPDPARDSSTLYAAIAVNLLNPNPYIGWTLVMGPLFLKGWGETRFNGIALIISFYTTMVLSLFILILLFHSILGVLPKLKRTLLGLSALTLAGLGLFDIYVGIKSFL